MKRRDWECSHCEMVGHGLRYDCGMPPLCDKCHKEFDELFIEFLKKKFPPHGYMDFGYANYTRYNDRKRLCIEWNKKEHEKFKRVQFT